MNNLKIALLFFVYPLLFSAQENIDLFIWAGQSNAQGYTGDALGYPMDGQELDTSILLNYTVFGKESSNGEWVTMQPQKGRYPAGHFGPEVSFARRLKNEGYYPAIFKYSLGGTGLARDWKGPNAGGIYDNMIKDLRVAIQKLRTKGYKINIRGFIWIQGETDAGNDNAAREYRTNLLNMVEHLREEFKVPDLNIILGVDEQHHFLKERPIVLEAQKRIAQEDKNIIYTTMYGLPKADRTHLTPLGLVEHGHRIYDAYKILVNTASFSSSDPPFADCWEFVGTAVEEPGYVIWGTSPILGDDGKIHLFVARWPGNTVEPGWRSNSEIAHYVGDNPEGPFKFSDLALKGTGEDTWDRFGMHNPTIHKIGEKYALLYIANNNPIQPPHPSNQKIGLAMADSPYGPWKKVNKDGLILDAPENPDYWNFEATNGVNNPSLLEHPDGGFFLYFKSEKAKMGLAVAEKIEGPYVQLPYPVTKNEQSIEDGYAFMYEGKFAILTTDNHGIIEEGGGILWTSEDGMIFDRFEKGFHRIDDYIGLDMAKITVHYGPKDRKYAKFERPQMLLKNGKPFYLYLPSGSNINGGPSTASYILKYKK